MTTWARYGNPVLHSGSIVLEEGPINLDGADDIYLIKFSSLQDKGHSKAAKIMFPGEKKATSTIKLLSRYAEHTVAARGFRSLGQIEEAMKHERTAEAIYQRLPEYARW